MTTGVSGVGLTNARDIGPRSWPLTTAQRLLWVGQKLHPDAPLYNMAFVHEIACEIDPETFRKAFAAFIAGNESLRMTIGETEGEPFQTVHEKMPFELSVLDFCDSPDPATSFKRWATSACKSILPIDRITFDASLAKLGASSWGFYFNQHHLLYDASSAAIVFRQIVKAYDDVAAAREPNLSDQCGFTEYVEMENASASDVRANEHWKRVRQRQGDAPALYGKRSVARVTETLRRDTPLGAERMARLKALARSGDYRALTTDLSIFRILATVAFAFVSRVSTEKQITIGALSHNRLDRRFTQSTGNFVEMLPFGVEVEDGDSFHTLFLKVRAETDRFLRAVGPGASDPSLLKGASVVFNMIRSDMGDFAGATVRTTWLHTGYADDSHPLRIHAHDYNGDGALTVSFDLNKGVFAENEADAVSEDFLALLDAMLLDDAIAIDAAPLVDPKSPRAAVLIGDPPVVAFFSVVDSIFANCSRTPESVAIEDKNSTLTYGMLWRHASALAAKLKRGQRVAICLPRSIDAITAILAAQIAGAVFVPIDPTWPEERIRFLIGDSECSAAFCADDRELPVPIIPFVTACDQSSELMEPVKQRPDELAYILYTSGSTGKPKGVAVENRALGNYIGWASGFYDRGRGLSFPLFTKLTFDLTITSIFTPLVSGGRIIVYRESAESADLSVIDVLADDRVEIVKLTPAHLAVIADRDLSRSQITQMIIGGEELLTPLARRVHARSMGRIAVHNEYGPTEATVGCILHTYDPERDKDAAVPIGRPIAGMSALILDAHMKPTPRGVIGDLWLAGASLARDYLNLADLTAEKFCNLPEFDNLRAYKTGDKARLREDGVIEFFGREDAQIKLRGHRIELGEIEAVIADDPAISAVAVKLVQPNPISSVDISSEEVALSVPPVLAAFFVANNHVDVYALRERLKSKLPEVMIPSRFLNVEEMPLTPNGKIDRDALKLPDATRADFETVYVAPETGTEKAMCEIWSSVLKVDRVGATDDFYELGGDSISAIQIIARAQHQGVSISLTALLEARTIRKLFANSAATKVERKPHVGPTLLTPAQHGLFTTCSAPQECLSIVECDAPANMTVETLRSALATLVAHHDSLRMSFEEKGGSWIGTTHGDVVFPEIRVVSGNSEDTECRSEDWDWLAAPFDLSRHPLIRALVIEGQSGVSGLYFSAHQLIVDALSWMIFLDDLKAAHDAIAANKDPRLPTSISNQNAWVTLLGEQTAERREGDFWAKIVGSTAQSLDRWEVQATAPCMSTIALSADETATLLSNAPNWRIGIDELIGAALVTTFFDSSSNTPVRLYVQRQGRESWREGIDARRIVGSLGSIFPVLVNLQGSDNLLELAAAMKDALRAARHGGVGYGALRYLASDERGPALAENDSSTQILMNHCGQLEPVSGRLSRRRPIEFIRAPENGVFGLVSNSIVHNGELRIALQSSLGRFTSETLDTAAQKLGENLRALISAFEKGNGAPMTAGDFPLADLDRASLNDLAAILGAAEN